MKNSIRKLTLAVLSAVLFFCVVLLCLPAFTASAATFQITKKETADEIYSFVPGASISSDFFGFSEIKPDEEGFDLNTAKYDLRFSLKLEDIDTLNLNDLYQYADSFAHRAENYFIYEFTLYREKPDGDGTGNSVTVTDCYSVINLLMPFLDNRNNIQMFAFIYVKDYNEGGIIQPTTALPVAESYSPNNLGNQYSDYANKFKQANNYTANGTTTTFGGGYQLISYHVLSESGLAFSTGEASGYTTGVRVKITSPFQSYFVRMRYFWNRQTYSGGMFNIGQTYKQNYGYMDSSSRSVAQILHNMQELDVDFADEFTPATVDYANLILSNETKQRVRVKYLQQIGDTPFAAPVYAYVNVPVVIENGKKVITVPDVEEALEISLQRCLDTNSYYFEWIETGAQDIDLFGLYYLPNVYLRAFTVDGNTVDRFLDINLSFYDKFYPLVDAGVMEQARFEFIFNQILNDYPALADYRDQSDMTITFASLYGYFGFVALPDSYSLNSTYKKLFDLKTSEVGEISYYDYSVQLSFENYHKLLDDCRYGFLSHIWAEVEGFIEGSSHQATYYVMFSLPGTRFAIIGEGGQDEMDDNGGAIAQDAVQPIIGAVEDTLEIGKEVVGGAIEGGKNLLGGITDWVTGVTSNTKTIIWVLVFGAIGVAIIYVVLKTRKRR